MEAGDLDRRITFQRSQETSNEMNEPVENWSDLMTVWARRRDVSDSEKDAAGQVGGSLMSRFVVRSSEQAKAVLLTDRIFHDDKSWNIRGIKQADEGRNRFLEITAVARID
ncbi:phage head closure protein [uncultured Agrobacterium sp.]|uniref:phage head closure protein n=1 Tax=uncultured Agrobacterium sp. TaxID=157277 RepID=UPI002589CDD3|nr:phage head closure protein [uncultured Agrobacterium sp.]